MSPAAGFVPTPLLIACSDDRLIELVCLPEPPPPAATNQTIPLAPPTLIVTCPTSLPAAFAIV